MWLCLLLLVGVHQAIPLNRAPRDAYAEAAVVGDLLSVLDLASTQLPNHVERPSRSSVPWRIQQKKRPNACRGAVLQEEDLGGMRNDRDAREHHDKT